MLDLNKSFKFIRNKHITALDFVMPEALKGIFKISMLGKCAVTEGTDGEPAKIWSSLFGGFENLPSLVAPMQVHGTDFIIADESSALPLRPEADGVFITPQSSADASLRFADCTPVAIAGSEPQPWLVLLHSGFAGTCRNITFSALSKLKDDGKISLTGAHAWIGPAICKNCYFRRKDDPNTELAMASFYEGNYNISGDSVYFDLPGQIHMQLTDIGIMENRIYLSNICTLCKNGIFYSYRGGDKKNRNFLFASNTTNRHL